MPNEGIAAPHDQDQPREPDPQRPRIPHTGKADEVKAHVLKLAQERHQAKMRVLHKKEQLIDAKLQAANKETEYWATRLRQINSNRVGAAQTEASSALWQPFMH